MCVRLKSAGFIKMPLPVPYNKQSSQLFYRRSFSGKNALPTSELDILKDDRVSTVAHDRKQNLVFKFIKARKWHEYYKVLYGFSRTSKEIKANSILSELGFSVPYVHEFGIGVFPTFLKGYTGYYVMNAVSGYGDCSTHLHNLNPESRERFVTELIRDLSLLKNNHIIYSDLSLSNMYCGYDGKLTWIDTAIKQYKGHKNCKNEKFEQNWKKSFGKLMDSQIRLKILNVNEIEQIKRKVGFS